MAKIKVCDAIMGSGKTESCITYMNEHKDEKFIFITPYLKEVDRIIDSCPGLEFEKPSNKFFIYGNTKVGHTAHLIKEGKNIATTHQSFKNYTPEMLDDIRKMHYTLFIDENVDAIESVEISSDDVQILIDSGMLSNDNGYLEVMKEYSGGIFNDFFGTLTSKNLMMMNDEAIDKCFFWILPPELITAFDNVCVLTYMFKSQGLYYMFSMYDLPYEYIGVSKSGNRFRFAECGDVPEYVSHIKDMIEIPHDKINNIGFDRTALSMAWFANEGNITAMKAHAENWFNNRNRGIDVSRRVWGTYSSFSNKLRGHGYAKNHLVFNTRATNSYRDKDCLMYAANPYMNVGIKLFLKSRGVDVDEDMYALSTLVQWIWRTAIRDGKPIKAYIPSSRMRGLLEDWIDKLAKGGDGR